MNEIKPSNEDLFKMDEKLALIEEFKTWFTNVADETDYAIIESAIYMQEYNDAIVTCVALSVDNEIEIKPVVRMQILSLLQNDLSHLEEIHYYFNYYQNPYKFKHPSFPKFLI